MTEDAERRLEAPTKRIRLPEGTASFFPSTGEIPVVTAASPAVHPGIDELLADLGIASSSGAPSPAETTREPRTALPARRRRRRRWIIGGATAGIAVGTVAVIAAIAAGGREDTAAPPPAAVAVEVADRSQATPSPTPKVGAAIRSLTVDDSTVACSSTSASVPVVLAWVVTGATRLAFADAAAAVEALDAAERTDLDPESTGSTATYDCADTLRTFTLTALGSDGDPVSASVTVTREWVPSSLEPPAPIPETSGKPRRAPTRIPTAAPVPTAAPAPTSVPAPEPEPEPSVTPEPEPTSIEPPTTELDPEPTDDAIFP